MLLSAASARASDSLEAAESAAGAAVESVRDTAAAAAAATADAASNAASAAQAAAASAHAAVAPHVAEAAVAMTRAGEVAKDALEDLAEDAHERAVDFGRGAREAVSSLGVRLRATRERWLDAERAEVATWLAEAALPPIDPAAPAESLLARATHESGLHRTSALRALGRASFADRAAAAVTVGAVLSLGALGGLGLLFALLGAGTERAVQLGLVATFVFAAAALASVVASQVRRGQRALADLSFLRADTAEQRATRLAVALAVRATDPAKSSQLLAQVAERR